MEDTERHFVGKVAQKAIIEHDGKVLVCRGIGDSVWEFPGGRLHKGESPQEGLAREILEELQLPIVVERPVYTCLSYHSKSGLHNMFVAYTCSVTDSTLLRQDVSEVEEIKWVSLEELKTLPMFDDCRGAVAAYLKKLSS